MFELTFDLAKLNFITIVFRLILAILVGGLIGFDRNVRNQAAGLRTHILVSLGSSIMMMTNLYVYDVYKDANIDPTRMGSYVISGISFIGAGTILVTNENRIKGLATAASIWGTTALGLAIGSGFYAVTIAGTVLTIAIIILLRPFTKLIQNKTKSTDLSLIIFSKNGFNNFLEYITSIDANVSSLDIEQESSSEKGDAAGIIFTISINVGDQMSTKDFLKKLRAIEGIQNVVEINSSS